MTRADIRWALAEVRYRQRIIRKARKLGVIAHQSTCCTMSIEILKAKIATAISARKAWKAKQIDIVAHCDYCDCPLLLNEATIDDIVPVSRGGNADSPTNWALCCVACNRRKAANYLVATGWKLNRRRRGDTEKCTCFHCAALRRANKPRGPRPWGVAPGEWE